MKSTRSTRLLMLLLALWALSSHAADQAQTGWDALLTGAPLVRAEAALRADLDRDPSDAGAAYALALAQQAAGEREKAVVTALEGLRNAPGSPLSFLLEELVGDDATFNLTTTRLVTEALPMLVARPEMDPLVRFNLRWLAYELAARQGNREERLAAMVRAGFVPGALFSEAQKDLSRTEFYEAGAPERGDFSKTRWRYSKLEGLQCSPPALDMPAEREFNIYSLVPFKVSKGVDAILYFNAAKPFQVFLDDRPLLTRDVFKRQENPTALRRVTLSSGWHRLLVKVHGMRSDAGIHLAFLDPSGQALSVQWGEALPDAPAAGFRDGGDWRGAFWSDFSSADPRFEAFSGLWYRWLGDVAQGRLLMEEAAEKAPKCLAWNLLTAKMYLTEADDLSPKIAQSRAEKALDAALAVDASCPLSLFLKSMLQGVNSDGDEDLATLSALVEHYPADSRWFVALAGRFQEKGWVAQARAVLERASSCLPQCEGVESAWISFYQGLPDPQSMGVAIGRLQALRDVGPEREAYLRVTRKWEDLHRLLEEEAVRYGDRDGHFALDLAKLEMRMGLYEAAQKRLESLAEQDPRDTEIALLLARTRFLKGDAEGGRRAWNALKAAKPDAFQVDMARWAMGEPLPFQERHLELERVLREDTSKEPEAAPSSLLLDQMFTRVERDGSSLERYHGIIRINDKEGVDRESEQTLPGQVVLSLRTIKPDGRILEPEQIPNKETISMQGLEAGDIIEYEYITLKPPSGVRPNAYVTAQVYLFQDIEKPFHRTQWTIEWPESIPMQFYEQNLPAPCKKGKDGGLRWQDWDYRDMPRIAPEPDTPNKMLYVPLVEAVGGITWEDLGRFLKEGITGAYQITPEVERCYLQAVGDAKSPEDKASRIVSYLLKQVDSERVSGWQDPTQVLMTRQGSRIPVAAAFLTLAGIPFDVLVAETVPDRVYRENLPRIGQFSAPVLKVNLPSGPRYLTLASPYRDPYILPWYLQGARAVCASAREPWKEIDLPADFGPWRTAAESEARQLMSDGDVRVEHRQVLDPEASESLRGALRRLDKDQWRQAVQVALSKQHGNLDLIDFSVDNVDDPFKPVGWNYTIIVHGYAAGENGKLTVPDPLPALHLGQVFASLRERKLPLTTGGPIFLNQKFTLELPAGFKMDYPMATLDLNTGFGSYNIASAYENGKLSVERRAEIPYEIVWPAKYEAFSEFLGKVDQAEAGQLVARVP